MKIIPFASVITALILVLCACTPSENGKTEALSTDNNTEETAMNTAEITSATATETMAQTELVSSPSSLLKSGQPLRFAMKRLAKIQPTTVNNTLFKQLQGGCTDGKYVYFALNDTKASGSMSLIYKVDTKTYETVSVSEPLQLDHCNDMTYNENLKSIVVVHNAPNREKISYLDPETLTVTGTERIGMTIFSMQYNASRNCYVVGLSGGQNFAVLDSDFKFIKKYDVDSTGYVTQGVDADDDFIYFVQYNQNVVVIYDWDGKRIDIVKLKMTTGEPECICHIGNTFYVGYSSNGIVMYSAILEVAED